jgi:hypothetical protein
MKITERPIDHLPHLGSCASENLSATLVDDYTCIAADLGIELREPTKGNLLLGAKVSREGFL